MLAAAPSLPRLYARAALTARGRGGSLPGRRSGWSRQRSTVTGCCATSGSAGSRWGTRCRTPTRTCWASRSRWSSCRAATSRSPCPGWSTSRTPSPSTGRCRRRSPGPHRARRGPARTPQGHARRPRDRGRGGGRACLERPEHLPAPRRAPPAGQRPGSLAAAAGQGPRRALAAPRGPRARVCRGERRREPDPPACAHRPGHGVPARHRPRHVDLRPAPWRPSVRAPVGRRRRRSGSASR